MDAERLSEEEARAKVESLRQEKREWEARMGFDTPANDASPQQEKPAAGQTPFRHRRTVRDRGDRDR